MRLPTADVILNNGPVFVSAARGVARALALWNGRVLAFGTESEIDALRGPGTRTVDLNGRLATPGLCEAHMHLLPLGLMMANVDVGRSSRRRWTISCASSASAPPGRGPASGSWRAATTSSNST